LARAHEPNQVQENCTKKRPRHNEHVPVKLSTTITATLRSIFSALPNAFAQ
jgi:hypothetical protein